MSNTPKINEKPKYNQNKPYEWVDSQWEKFITEQKELKSEILRLTLENSELKDEVDRLGGDLRGLVGRVPSKYLTKK